MSVKITGSRTLANLEEKINLAERVKHLILLELVTTTSYLIRVLYMYAMSVLDMTFYFA